MEIGSDEIKKIDELFASYNYDLRAESNNQVRIYTLRYGMYHAAEILTLNGVSDATKYKQDYSSLGYATEVKKYENVEALDSYLFDGFFIKTPLGLELKKRYAKFVDKQIQHLPEKSEYSYIDCAFDLIFEDQNNTIEAKSYSPSGKFEEKKSYLVDTVGNYLNEVNGALLVIIEAPAGFGKTCTAYEILNIFSPEESGRLPFFTELSRNREARVFKHILLNEIDHQFPNGIKQNVVLKQIQEGRIPLIIDGFDELISKESNKEDVESMLTTIVDLLDGNAKIILTSRKTAIFSSEEFLDNIYDSRRKFSIARIEIKEPEISTWISPERIKIIEEANFPIQQLANPVLLSYVRNIPKEDLVTYVKCDDDETLVEKYINFLLTREQTRQKLKIENETQLRIFRKLIRLMSEYNITSESKDLIKDFIKDYNIDILHKSLKLYLPEERPTVEELVDTLSNHVFLDRKSNDAIGFINDFISGYLIGENLLLNKFQEHYPESFTEVIPQDFALKSISAIKLRKKVTKDKLWDIYSENDFQYNSDFFFELDYQLKSKFNKYYNNLFISNRALSDITFEDDAKFEDCNFSQVSFYNTTFRLSLFNNTSFYNCMFYNCDFTDDKTKQFKDFALYACCSDNDFVLSVKNCFEEDSDPVVVENILRESDILKHFFKVDGVTPRARKFSYIKRALSEYSDKEVTNMIDSLISKEYLHFSDDMGYITRQAIYKIKHNQL